MDPEKTPGPRLLVVDDEPLIRWFLAHGLEAAGFEVVAAETAAQAVLEFGAGDQVCLVVLDLKLPDGDGLSVLRELKSRRPACPVILMSAHGTADTRREAMEAGAYEMVSKPFGIETMLDTIRTAIA